MIVMKFGGTSLATAELLDAAVDIAAGALDGGVVLVASAMGKTTDRLQLIADAAAAGRQQAALTAFAELHGEHRSAAAALLTGTALARCTEELDRLFAELDRIVTGLALLRQWTARSNDAILGFGERAVTALLAARATARGIDARLLDCRRLILTDDQFTRANVDYAATAARIQAAAVPAPGQLLVAQGFIAATADGAATTLGRGGSDYTATLFGAALGADEVVIWTDVDGIMTCDPRLVSEARTLPRISYREAAELAYFGARVVHPATIQPAVSRGIPVAVRNARRPQAPGTRIHDREPLTGPKAIAFKRGITLLNVSSSRMLLAYGFLRRIFEIFEHHHTPVDLVTTSEVSVSMTIDSAAELEGITRELARIGAVSVDRDATLVSVVGQDLWGQAGFLAAAVGALQGVPLKMLALGASDINLSLVVPDGATETAVRSLHRTLFEQPGAAAHERC